MSEVTSYKNGEEKGTGSKVKKELTNGETPPGSGVSIEGFHGVQQADTKEYINNYKAHKTGISHEEMVEVYTKWADDYDKDLCPGRYNGPEIAAKAMTKHYSEDVRPELRILDVAAGTGRVGEELVNNGFRHIDALEPSPGMLKKLRERNIYEAVFQSAVGDKPVEDISSNTYDALVIAGGMGEGHIPVKAVDEMVRVVKPGGIIFIVMREEYLSYVQEYVGRLEPYMNDLEKKGIWKQISREIVKEYSFNKDGVVFAHEVLA